MPTTRILWRSDDFVTWMAFSWLRNSPTATNSPRRSASTAGTERGPKIEAQRQMAGFRRIPTQRHCRHVGAENASVQKIRGCREMLVENCFVIAFQPSQGIRHIQFFTVTFYASMGSQTPNSRKIGHISLPSKGRINWK